MSTSFTGSWLGLLAAALSTGCVSTVHDGAEGGSGGGGGAGGEAPAYFDLYSCELPLACESMSLHTSIWPEDAPECAARLVARGEAGLLQTNFAPGPHENSFKKWIYVLGDGTAIVQASDKTCTGWDSCVGPVLGPHLRCTIIDHDRLRAECDPSDLEDADCVWDPFFEAFEDCQEITEQDCASVVAFHPVGGD